MTWGEFCAQQEINPRERAVLAEALKVMRRKELTWGGGGSAVSWKDMLQAACAAAYRAERLAEKNIDPVAKRESQCHDAVANILLSVYLHREKVVPILQQHPKSQ
jgi:hypothetical protein